MSSEIYENSCINQLVRYRKEHTFLKTFQGHASTKTFKQHHEAFRFKRLAMKI